MTDVVNVVICLLIAVCVVLLPVSIVARRFVEAEATEGGEQ